MGALRIADTAKALSAGHGTLSADDIVLYYLNKHPGAFQFVFCAEEDPNGKDHQALILTGSDGVQRLRELRQSVGESIAPQRRGRLIATSR